MQAFKIGDMIYNTKTGDHGICVGEFESSRQINISVKIPHREHVTFWHLPDVKLETSLEAVSVGDMAEYITATGRKTIAPILYISRAFTWCVLDIHGQEQIAHSSVITRAMPAKMGA